MKAVIQRVNFASVEIEGRIYSSIKKGFLVFLAIGQEDKIDDCIKMADKISKLRIFSNENGKFDYSIEDIKGEILIISQFTLYGDASKGRRPDFTKAAIPQKARELYEKTVNELIKRNLPVETGIFAADMLVKLENDGPVTIIYET